MAKTRSKFVCSNCGKQTSSFMGRCPNCGEFNTMQEVIEEVKKAGSVKQDRQTVGTLRSKPQRLRETDMTEEERLFVPVAEF
ncbi:MAG TPA: hypothetical protein PLZ51_19735, partial [Aggregatilineales bacterium]|nr:hypothetical protein [Aggregatilineales bacterium]